MIESSEIKFAGSIGPKLRFKKPMTLKIERHTIVSWQEEWGDGDSLGTALYDFGKSIRELWEIVHSGTELGPDMQRIKILLEEHIDEIPNRSRNKLIDASL